MYYSYASYNVDQSGINHDSKVSLKSAILLGSFSDCIIGDNLYIKLKLRFSSFQRSKLQSTDPPTSVVKLPLKPIYHGALFVSFGRCEGWPV